LKIEVVIVINESWIWSDWK